MTLEDLKWDDYLQFINEPKHLVNPVRGIRLFDSRFLEIVTSTPWYLIPIAYFPPITYLLYLSSQENSTLIQLLSFLGVMLWWTFSEYYLHRFFFHSEDSWLPNHPKVLAFHFMLHGVHHAYPMDRLRLVFPPIPGVAVHFVLILVPMSYIIPHPYLYGVASGELFGYVLYDMIHYYLHHATPKDPYFKDLKRYHMLHHYKQGTIGFGVSNKVWDFVFGSEIKY